MNVTVESLPNCVTTLRLEVPSEKVKQTREAITKDYAKQAKLPGFRPGKAPRNVVETKFQKQISEDLQQRLLEESTREAILQEKLRVLTVQNVDEFEIAADQSARITATLITAPVFELPEYKGIPVTVPEGDVTDEEVDKSLEELRDRYADFKDIEDRGLQMDDFAVVNYSGTVDGKPVDEVFPKAGKRMTAEENRWIRITPETFLPGFTEALLGAKVGEQRQAELTVPDDFPAEEMRGQKLSYSVTITGIKLKQLKDLNDEFADTVVKGKTLADLRDMIRDDLKRRREEEIDSAKRNQVVDALLSKVECELPQAMVTTTAQRIIEDLVRENQARGITDEILKENEKQLFGVASETARARVKASFILERVAEAEKIEVTAEELKRRIYSIAMRYGMSFEKALKEFQKRNALGEIREEILTGKALDFLVSNASVQTVAQPAS